MAALFDNTPATDAAALAVLAGRAVGRDELVAGGYVNVAKSADLFGYGYSVSFWVKPGARESLLLEFMPRAAGVCSPALPRLTATSYEEQRAVHEAIGARVVPPGRRFAG